MIEKRVAAEAAVDNFSKAKGSYSDAVGDGLDNFGSKGDGDEEKKL